MHHAPKAARTTPVTGQYGSYLAKDLLEKGCVEHGVTPGASLSMLRDKPSHARPGDYNAIIAITPWERP